MLVQDIFKSKNLKALLKEYTIIKITAENETYITLKDNWASDEYCVVVNYVVAYYKRFGNMQKLLDKHYTNNYKVKAVFLGCSGRNNERDITLDEMQELCK